MDLNRSVLEQKVSEGSLLGGIKRRHDYRKHTFLESLWR